MRPGPEIEARIQERLASELSRRLDVPVVPTNCRHNLRQPLDYRKTIFGDPNDTYNRISISSEKGKALPVVQTIGLCGLGQEDTASWSGTICEEPIDAQRCKKRALGFEPKSTPSEVYTLFVREVTEPKWLEDHLPEVSSLLWVLGSKIDHVEDAALPSPPERSPLPSFWVRLWLALRPPAAPTRRLPDPPADVTVYLPKPPDANRP